MLTDGQTSSVHTSTDGLPVYLHLDGWTLRKQTCRRPNIQLKKNNENNQFSLFQEALIQTGLYKTFFFF